MPAARHHIQLLIRRTRHGELFDDGADAEAILDLWKAPITIAKQFKTGEMDIFLLGYDDINMDIKPHFHSHVNVWRLINYPWKLLLRRYPPFLN